MQYRDDGYLPEALLTIWCVWAGPTAIRKSSLVKSDQILHSECRQQICQRVQHRQLLWLNHHYINALPPEYVATTYSGTLSRKISIPVTARSWLSGETAG